MALYNTLSPEGKTLLNAAVEHLFARMDPAVGLVKEDGGGQQARHSIRGSLYLALGKLMQGDADAPALAQTVCEAVCGLQLNDPGQIWHGCFRHPWQAPPPALPGIWQQLSPGDRYLADWAWERTTARAKRLLEASLPDRQARDTALRAMREALCSAVPVTWDTYEPNLREFVGMCFAMLLQHFAPQLPASLTARLEESGRLLAEGALARRKADLTPLNTNIRIMYIFVMDWFGTRLHQPAWQAEALADAETLLREYNEFHAVAEYNSPTYCGVDLSTLGFWRRYGSNARLGQIASLLEDGIWHDMAAFYNPSLRNFCGPYSRAYEMDMAIHTCFYSLLYWQLGARRFPWHPFSTESPLDPLMLLGDVRIPEDVAQALTQPRPGTLVRRQFRELSERGEPGLDRAVCTATAWITPQRMWGALEGSLNPSDQLRPLTVFWRCGQGVGTLHVQRMLPDGTSCHLHTVLFHGAADEKGLTLGVENRTDQDVDICFEIQCPGLCPQQIAASLWNLPGLRVYMEAQAPAPRVVPVGSHCLRVIYASRVDVPQTLRMAFALRMEGTAADGES